MHLLAVAIVVVVIIIIFITSHASHPLLREVVYPASSARATWWSHSFSLAFPCAQRYDEMCCNLYSLPLLSHMSNIVAAAWLPVQRRSEGKDKERHKQSAGTGIQSHRTHTQLTLSFLARVRLCFCGCRTRPIVNYPVKALGVLWIVHKVPSLSFARLASIAQ